MTELLRVRGCENQARLGDIVFVHGLNGNPRDYWYPAGKPEKYWPAWLGEDLPELGIWSLGYENAALKPRWFSVVRPILGLRSGFAMPLQDRAENVLHRLELEGIGQKPIVFVTHSMGGLLVKQMLRIAYDHGSKPRRKAILEETRGVCFIATPHIGADLAKWASYFRTLLGTNVSVGDLQPHEPNLRSLNTWYRNFAGNENSKISTVTYFEMKPSPHGALVVEPGDADPGIPNSGLYPLDEDHVSICKPISKTSDIYIGVLNFISRDCFQTDVIHSGGSSLSEGPLPSTSYVYALGRVLPRFPSLAVEKQFAQALAGTSANGLSDRQALDTVLRQRENLYLARQLCWVLAMDGVDTFILRPRDPEGILLLAEATEPTQLRANVVVIVGSLGPIAPPQMCRGLTLPIVDVGQLFFFDLDSAVKSIPLGEAHPHQQEAPFDAAEALFLSILEDADNTGTTDEHRALNYLAVSYPIVYARAAEAYLRNLRLMELGAHPSRTRDGRKLVDVIFSYQDPALDITEKCSVRVDVTELFPFLVTRLAPCQASTRPTITVPVHLRRQ
jgi:PatG Domain/Putative serine esterase (DUF676)